MSKQEATSRLTLEQKKPYLGLWRTLAIQAEVAIRNIECPELTGCSDLSTVHKQALITLHTLLTDMHKLLTPSPDSASCQATKALISCQLTNLLNLADSNQILLPAELETLLIQFQEQAAGHHVKENGNEELSNNIS